MVVGFTTTYAINAHQVVSSNPDHDEVYSMQHYVIKFVSDATVQWLSPVSSTDTTDQHDITEIVLKVASNTP